MHTDRLDIPEYPVHSWRRAGPCGLIIESENRSSPTVSISAKFLQDYVLNNAVSPEEGSEHGFYHLLCMFRGGHFSWERKNV